MVASKATPEQQAAATRKMVLEQARRECWPQSADVGRALGYADDGAARQCAHRMRDNGEVLGLWSCDERTFYYPPFQFLPDGRPHPRLSELLTALSEIPTFAPAEDPSGWGRNDWLLQPLWSLSERNLAYAASIDGVVAGEEHLSSNARAPADVFVANPEAAIATAHADASEVRAGR